jgi:hypothetical protein
MYWLSRGGVEVDSSVVGQPGDPLGHQHRWASAPGARVTWFALRLRRRRACLAWDGGSALSRGRWRTVRPGARRTGTAVDGALVAYAVVIAAVMASAARNGSSKLSSNGTGECGSIAARCRCGVPELGCWS